MPEIAIEIEIWCSCGNGLCSQSTVKRSRYGEGFVVEPCEKCLERARDEGYAEGHDAAFREEEER